MSQHTRRPYSENRNCLLRDCPVDRKAGNLGEPSAVDCDLDRLRCKVGGHVPSRVQPQPLILACYEGSARWLQGIVPAENSKIEAATDPAPEDSPVVDARRRQANPLAPDP